MNNPKGVQAMSDEDFLSSLLAGQPQSNNLGEQLNTLIKEKPEKPKAKSNDFQGLYREHLRSGS